ncbi:MAG: copper resistance protein CopZ [Clostridiales bacterium]|nr:copper resistance protein CopZ [Clostridiales bacterium]
MLKITLKIDGMVCGMCEAHINDAVRRAFPVKKVSSSKTKKETVIITETDIEEKQLYDVIKNTGYILTEIKKEPYEKKGFFGFYK